MLPLPTVSDNSTVGIRPRAVPTGASTFSGLPVLATLPIHSPWPDRTAIQGHGPCASRGDGLQSGQDAHDTGPEP